MTFLFNNSGQFRKNPSWRMWILATCRKHDMLVCVMSGFSAELVILLLSANTHRVFHLAESHSHPFVCRVRRVLSECRNTQAVLHESCDCSLMYLWFLLVEESDRDRSLESDWLRWGNWNLEQDLWSRAAIVLSKPLACNHSLWEDALVGRNKSGKNRADEGRREVHVPC